MKAISQDILGGPEVLRTVEVPRPTPRAGQVLVRMSATSVNPVDCKLRTGAVTHLGPPPFTLGFDLSGTVVEIGPGVESFEPGDDVFGMIFSRKGAYGEYALASADALVLRPASLDPIHAGVLPTAALTAWQAIDLADVQSGERVLIHAAAGGVGHLAVQFAHLRGAHVIGTARTVNHDFLRALGADELVDYTKTDFATSVQEVDVVIDLVGGNYGSRSLRILRADGRYVDAQGSDGTDDPRYRRVVGHPSPDDLTSIGRLVIDGKVRVEIEQTLSLADVAEAHKLSESGRVRGKLALTPWGP